MFAGARYIKQTDEVKTKLSNYDNLQSQVNSLSYTLNHLKGDWLWYRNHGSERRDQVNVYISDNNVSVSVDTEKLSLGTLELKKQ